jgi:hypothetical protein
MFSKDEDDDKIEAANKQLEIEFKEEFSAFIKRKQSYETNTSKVYAFLWEQCAKGMQSKIESSEKFESEIKNNPIKLLECIKKYALNYHEHRYEMSIMSYALRSMILLKQKEGESLQDYTKRFKKSRAVPHSHIGGTTILSIYVEEMVEYKANPKRFKGIGNVSRESISTASCIYIFRKQ